MIACHFFRSAAADRIVGFAVSGHDEADDSGVSLLCCAVSSAVYLTVNTITDICGVVPLACEQADGLLTLRLRPEDADVCKAHLEGLALHLNALSGDYPEQLDFTITEV